MHTFKHKVVINHGENLSIASVVRYNTNSDFDWDWEVVDNYNSQTFPPDRIWASFVEVAQDRANHLDMLEPREEN